MKKLSQLIFIIFCILFFINSSCKKEVAFMNDAIITGSDARTCICCGGLMITFDGESRPYSGDFKLIDNPAVDLGIKEKDTFPIYVKVDWKVDTTNVCHHIIITKIARR
jgi:hypothetical protein